MYTYEDIKKYIKPHIANQIVCIFKNGSQLFCDNCKEYDYTIITSRGAGTGIFYIPELNADCFVMSAKELNRKMQNDLWRYKLSVCLAKDNPSNIIYGELPELDIDTQSRDYLLKILQIEYEFAQKTYFKKQGESKTIVWGLALMYAINNGNFQFTDEQKDIMTACHDADLVETYGGWLKTEMEKLLNL